MGEREPLDENYPSHPLRRWMAIKGKDRSFVGCTVGMLNAPRRVHIGAHF